MNICGKLYFPHKYTSCILHMFILKQKSFWAILQRMVGRDSKFMDNNNLESYCVYIYIWQVENPKRSSINSSYSDHNTIR